MLVYYHIFHVHTILVLALGTFHNFHTNLIMGDNFTQLLAHCFSQRLFVSVALDFILSNESTPKTQVGTQWFGPLPTLLQYF